MKQKIEDLIQHAIKTLKDEGVISLELNPQITIDRARDAQHGDFASNLALIPATVNRSEMRCANFGSPRAGYLI